MTQTKHTPASGEFRKAMGLWNAPVGLHVIQFPSGKWGYVGNVPARLYWADGTTDDQIAKAAQFGAGFVTPRPKTRTFDSKEAAEQFAAAFKQ